jgi:hypothetical protein
MVESMRRQGFACLRDGKRTEKRRLQKAGSSSAQKLGHNVWYDRAAFIGGLKNPNLSYKFLAEPPVTIGSIDRM